MRRIGMLLLILLLLCGCAYAQEPEPETEVVTDGLSDEARELLPTENAGTVDLWDGAKTVLTGASARAFGGWHEALRLCALLLACGARCGRRTGHHGRDGRLDAEHGAACCRHDRGAVGLRNLYAAGAGLGDGDERRREQLDRALRRSGAVFSAADARDLEAADPGRPAEAALGNQMLTELRKLIGWLISKGLRLSVGLFLAYLSFTGVITASVDASAAKMTKAAVSGMVPVVGGMISDASETLLASAGVLKNSVGVFGMLAVLAIALTPFLRVAAHYLLLRLTTAVGGAVGLKPHVTLLEQLTTAMGFLLAMCAACCLLLLMATVCLMRVVV